MSDREKTMIVESADQLMQPASRRKFLRMLGVGGTVVLMPSLFAACSNDDDNPPTGISSPPPPPPPPTQSLSLNLSTDAGILSYAYLLEQLEAAFYTQALDSTGFSQLSAPEKEVLTDLQKHEVIHREFLKAVLGAAATPLALTFNATTVTALTKDRATLLSTSQLLEDTGVSAYNGAGKYLTVAANLTVAGKIVSVEARHAAAIRDIRDNTGKQFAGDDVVGADGLDVKAEPDEVLTAVKGLNVITSPTTITIGTNVDQSKKTPSKQAPPPFAATA
jgi:beta-phosphoglucomutase-like phosphatase (HAD superfamily)